MEDNTIENNLAKQRRKARNYPKRVYRSEAERIAVICLRDCANLSFITITRLLGHSDIQKMNIMKCYESNKEKYRCKQCQQEPVLNETKTEII